MTEAVLDIKKWGNSLGVRLPAAVAREAKLHADQRVQITVEEGRITITPLGESQHDPGTGIGTLRSNPARRWGHAAN